MSYTGPDPFRVGRGGTGATSLVGVVSGNGTTPLTATAVTQYAPIIGGASNAVASVGIGTSGQVLQSKGAGVAADYSTATYPATTTANQLLYSSATNTVGEVTTANNGVLITSAAGVPSLLAAGTTGQVLTATTGAPASWAAPAAGGGMVWLATATASTSATLDFTGIDATYNTYLFVFDKVLATDNGAVFWMRTSTDGGTSYDAGASDYETQGSYWLNTNAPVTNSSVGATSILLTPTTGNGALDGVFGSLILYNPSATTYTHVTATLRLSSSDAVTTIYSLSSGVRASAADVDAVRFLYGAGNIASGSIRMYGMTTPA